MTSNATKEKEEILTDPLIQSLLQEKTIELKEQRNEWKSEESKSQNEKPGDDKNLLI